MEKFKYKNCTTLADFKQAQFNAIDYKTGALIGAGFTFDSKQFSLSPTAQINWQAIKGNTSDFTFPLELTTLDNDVYSLTDANVQGFWDAGKATLKGHLDAGRALKKTVFDATTIEEVQAIVDAR